MSRMIDLARAGRNKVAPAPEEYRPVAEDRVAADFVAWMREHDGDGWWAACEIDELFVQFCKEQDRPRLRLDTLRSLMLNVPGVYRKRHRLRGAFEDIGRATGLERATLYWIPPSETIVGPWPDPDRTEPGPSPDCARTETGPCPDPAHTVPTPWPDRGHTQTGTQKLCEASIP